jgi:hypothetical protein
MKQATFTALSAVAVPLLHPSSLLFHDVKV